MPVDFQHLAATVDALAFRTSERRKAAEEVARWLQEPRPSIIHAIDQNTSEAKDPLTWDHIVRKAIVSVELDVQDYMKAVSVNNYTEATLIKRRRDVTDACRFFRSLVRVADRKSLVLYKCIAAVFKHVHTVLASNVEDAQLEYSHMLVDQLLYHSSYFSYLPDATWSLLTNFYTTCVFNQVCPGIPDKTCATLDIGLACKSLASLFLACNNNFSKSFDPLVSDFFIHTLPTFKHWAKESYNNLLSCLNILLKSGSLNHIHTAKHLYTAYAPHIPSIWPIASKSLKLELVYSLRHFLRLYFPQGNYHEPLPLLDELLALVHAEITSPLSVFNTFKSTSSSFGFDYSAYTFADLAVDLFFVQKLSAIANVQPTSLPLNDTLTRPPLDPSPITIPIPTNSPSQMKISADSHPSAALVLAPGSDYSHQPPVLSVQSLLEAIRTGVSGRTLCMILLVGILKKEPLWHLNLVDQQCLISIISALYELLSGNFLIENTDLLFWTIQLLLTITQRSASSSSSLSKEKKLEFPLQTILDLTLKIQKSYSLNYSVHSFDAFPLPDNRLLSVHQAIFFKLLYPSFEMPHHNPFSPHCIDQNVNLSLNPYYQITINLISLIYHTLKKSSDLAQDISNLHLDALLSLFKRQLVPITPESVSLTNLIMSLKSFSLTDARKNHALASSEAPYQKTTAPATLVFKHAEVLAFIQNLSKLNQPKQNKALNAPYSNQQAPIRARNMNLVPVPLKTFLKATKLCLTSIGILSFPCKKTEHSTTITSDFWFHMRWNPLQFQEEGLLSALWYQAQSSSSFAPHIHKNASTILEKAFNIEDHFIVPSKSIKSYDINTENAPLFVALLNFMMDSDLLKCMDTKNGETKHQSLTTSVATSPMSSNQTHMALSLIQNNDLVFEFQKRIHKLVLFDLFVFSASNVLQIFPNQEILSFFYFHQSLCQALNLFVKENQAVIVKRENIQFNRHLITLIGHCMLYLHLNIEKHMLSAGPHSSSHRSLDEINDQISVLIHQSAQDLVEITCLFIKYNLSELYEHQLRKEDLDFGDATKDVSYITETFKSRPLYAALSGEELSRSGLLLSDCLSLLHHIDLFHNTLHKWACNPLSSCPLVLDRSNNSDSFLRTRPGHQALINIFANEINTIGVHTSTHLLFDLAYYTKLVVDPVTIFSACESLLQSKRNDLVISCFSFINLGYLKDMYFNNVFLSQAMIKNIEWYLHALNSLYLKKTLRIETQTLFIESIILIKLIAKEKSNLPDIVFPKPISRSAVYLAYHTLASPALSNSHKRDFLLFDDSIPPISNYILKFITNNDFYIRKYASQYFHLTIKDSLPEKAMFQHDSLTDRLLTRSRLYSQPHDFQSKLIEIEEKSEHQMAEFWRNFENKGGADSTLEVDFMKLLLDHKIKAVCGETTFHSSENEVPMIILHSISKSNAHNVFKSILEKLPIAGKSYQLSYFLTTFSALYTMASKYDFLLTSTLKYFLFHLYKVEEPIIAEWIAHYLRRLAIDLGYRSVREILKTFATDLLVFWYILLGKGIQGIQVFPYKLFGIQSLKEFLTENVHATLLIAIYKNQIDSGSAMDAEVLVYTACGLEQRDAELTNPIFAKKIRLNPFSKGSSRKNSHKNASSTEEDFQTFDFALVFLSRMHNLDKLSFIEAYYPMLVAFILGRDMQTTNDAHGELLTYFLSHICPKSLSGKLEKGLSAIFFNVLNLTYDDKAPASVSFLQHLTPYDRPLDDMENQGPLNMAAHIPYTNYVFKREYYPRLFTYNSETTEKIFYKLLEFNKKLYRSLLGLLGDEPQGYDILQMLLHYLAESPDNYHYRERLTRLTFFLNCVSEKLRLEPFYLSTVSLLIKVCTPTSLVLDTASIYCTTTLLVRLAYYGLHHHKAVCKKVFIHLCTTIIGVYLQLSKMLEVLFSSIANACLDDKVNMGKFEMYNILQTQKLIVGFLSQFFLENYARYDEQIKKLILSASFLYSQTPSQDFEMDQVLKNLSALDDNVSQLPKTLQAFTDLEISPFYYQEYDLLRLKTIYQTLKVGFHDLFTNRNQPSSVNSTKKEDLEFLKVLFRLKTTESITKEGEETKIASSIRDTSCLHTPPSHITKLINDFTWKLILIVKEIRGEQKSMPSIRVNGSYNDPICEKSTDVKIQLLEKYAKRTLGLIGMQDFKESESRISSVEGLKGITYYPNIDAVLLKKGEYMHFKQTDASSDHVGIPADTSLYDKYIGISQKRKHGCSLDNSYFIDIIRLTLFLLTDYLTCLDIQLARASHLALNTIFSSPLIHSYMPYLQNFKPYFSLYIASTPKHKDKAKADPFMLFPAPQTSCVSSSFFREIEGIEDLERINPVVFEWCKDENIFFDISRTCNEDWVDWLKRNSYEVWVRKLACNFLAKYLNADLLTPLIFPLSTSKNFCEFYMPHLVYRFVEDHGEDLEICENLKTKLLYFLDQAINKSSYLSQKQKSACNLILDCIDFLYNRHVQYKMAHATECTWFLRIFKGFSWSLLAQVANECGHYSKALFYIERHYEDQAITHLAHGSERQLDLIKKIYANLGETDSVYALAHLTDIDSQLYFATINRDWARVLEISELFLDRNKEFSESSFNVQSVLLEINSEIKSHSSKPDYQYMPNKHVSAAPNEKISFFRGLKDVFELHEDQEDQNVLFNINRHTASTSSSLSNVSEKNNGGSPSTINLIGNILYSLGEMDFSCIVENYIKGLERSYPEHLELFQLHHYGTALKKMDWSLPRSVNTSKQQKLLSHVSFAAKNTHVSSQYDVGGLLDITKFRYQILQGVHFKSLHSFKASVDNLQWAVGSMFISVNKDHKKSVNSILAHLSTLNDYNLCSKVFFTHPSSRKADTDNINLNRSSIANLVCNFKKQHHGNPLVYMQSVWNHWRANAKHLKSMAPTSDLPCLIISNRHTLIQEFLIGYATTYHSKKSTDDANWPEGLKFGVGHLATAYEIYTKSTALYTRLCYRQGRHQLAEKLLCAHGSLTEFLSKAPEGQAYSLFKDYRQFYQAKLSWHKGQKDLAIHILKNYIVDLKSRFGVDFEKYGDRHAKALQLFDSGNNDMCEEAAMRNQICESFYMSPFFRCPKALLLCGNWLVEAKLAQPDEIITQYYVKAIDLCTSFLKMTNHAKMSELRSKCQYGLASFADAQHKHMISQKSVFKWEEAEMEYIQKEGEMDKFNSILHKDSSHLIGQPPSSILEGAVIGSGVGARLGTRKQPAEQPNKSKDNQLVQFIRNMKAQHKTDLHLLRTINQTADDFLLKAIKGYISCLVESTSYDLYIFRLISLWFDNYHLGDVEILIKEAISLIPSYKFIPTFYQLAARLTNAAAAASSSAKYSTKSDFASTTKAKKSTSMFQHSLAQLLYKISHDHPFHTIPTLMALSRSSEGLEGGLNSDKAAAAVNILMQLKQIKDGSYQRIFQNMELLLRGYDELAFYKLKDLQESRKFKPLSKLNLGDSLKICRIKNISDVHIPTAYLPADPTGKYKNKVGILSFEPTARLVGGISIPKRVVVCGLDGNRYYQLVKGSYTGSEDMRQDAVMQQIFSIVNLLLKRDKACAARNLGLRNYLVLPLTPRSGVLEWVMDTMPLGEYLVNNGHKEGYPLSAHFRHRPRDMPTYECRERMSKTSDRPDSEKLAQYLAVCSQFKPVFHKFFVEYFQNHTEWFERRLAYSRSVATSSMVGYTVGLGDRHIQNILIDKRTAELIHIDMGIAFDQGKLLPIPEILPFRLTRDLVQGLGIDGVSGVFKRCSEHVMHLMRANKDIILTIIDVFVHDPLCKWMLNQNKSRQLRRRLEQHDPVPNEISAGTFGDLIMPVMDVFRMGSETKEANKAAPLFEMTMDSTFTKQEATRVISRLQEKLSGIESGIVASVEVQVSSLIQEAMDEGNLSKMFSGWNAWI